ncbi:trihelix transcription factor PTL-like [Bidens hawaiensis]|uniref:trihelix transcription factor PTL-like n=1 Tax=Bidens hawaiensis TaxID=980011 RepID=UPI0040496F97
MDEITNYMNGRPVFPAIPQPPRDLHYAMVMLGGGGNMSFGSDSTMGMLSTTSGLSGDSGSGGACVNMEIDGRWPKEETLALLDIRSRLDSQFKGVKHKGPSWEEVSRIMYVEHGYKRTGKKCSVKFENLYKYYKKIKEGKAGKSGRQDQKHYRFFHQLEAIYGETSSTNITNINANKVSATNATLPPFMEENDQTIDKRMLGKKRWKTVISNFIETKMNTLMEKQEKWMEKVMNTIEEKENERISKELQRRKEEAARLEIERTFRSNELARMRSRDSNLMEALHKLTKKESTIETSCAEYCNDQDQVADDWEENEITQLIQLRSGMETRFEEGRFMENVLCEEISLIMAGLGYNRSALICKAKWDHINFLLRYKKQKGSSNLYFDHHNHIFHQAGERFNALNAQQNDFGKMVLMSDQEMTWNYNRNV